MKMSKVKELNAYTYSLVKIYKITNHLPDAAKTEIVDIYHKETNIYDVFNGTIVVKDINKLLTMDDIKNYHHYDFEEYLFRIYRIYPQKEEVRIFYLNTEDIINNIYYIQGTEIPKTLEFFYPFFGKEYTTYFIKLVDRDGKLRKYLPGEELKRKSKYPYYNPELPCLFKIINEKIEVVNVNTDETKNDQENKEDGSDIEEDEGLIIVCKKK